MSPLFWLDVVALSISTVVATSLALIVLGSGPKRALNSSFILFTLMEAAWAIFSLFLRLSLWLEMGNSLLLLELASLAFALMGPLLLMFTTRYVGRRAHRTDLTAVLGLIATGVLCIPLFRHQLISNPRLSANGATLGDLGFWGIVVALLLALYLVWSLILFGQERRRIKEPYLALSVLILLLGFTLGGILEVPFPVLSITNTLSVAILGYGVVSHQLFNPLRELTAKLEREVEERTQEITERMHKEQALRESEQWFRMIVDGLNDAIFIYDVDTGAIVDVNRKMCEMYGYAREELRELDIEALYSGERPYTQQEAMTWIKKALEGEPQIFEWRAKDKSGRLFWAEMNMRCAVMGGRDRLLVTVRDITERTQAEKIQTSLYRISEDVNLAQDLEELFRSIHSIVGQLMPAKNFCIALYDAAADLLSFPYWVDECDEKPAPQPPGKGLTACVLKTRKPLLASPPIFDELVAGGRVIIRGTPPVDWLGVPLTIQDKTIGVLAVQSYTEGVRYRNEDRDVLMFVSTQVARAIERKRAEEERERLLTDLKRRSTQLQTAAQVSKSAITSLDPEKLMDGAVNLIRDRFGFYYVGLFLVDEVGEYAVLWAGTGTAGQEMVAAGHKLLVGGPSMVGWCTAHGEARVALNVGEEVIRFHNPLLPWTRSEVVLPLMSHGQWCVGALTVQSAEEAAFSRDDVAILQTMADQLAIAIENARLYKRVQRYAAELEERVAERTAELAAVNKELEAFAYSVSHDLRAPLRAIDGFSQALLEDHMDILDVTAQDYLQRVRAASQRMGQLIDDLLNLSRVTRGELYREPVDLSGMAEDIAAELQATQPERQVVFDISSGLVVEGDMRLLRVVLENLLSNAWKFTSKKACVTIQFGALQVDGQRVYFVRDDGAGFDSAYTDKLFTPFQRLHSRFEFEGSGIGLATVQRIINRHGGRVWAEGAVDKGATFYFTL